MAASRDTAAPPAVPISHSMESDFGWALATTLKSYMNAIDVAVSGLPGGERGWRLLSAIARERTESQLSLARMVGLDRTVVTYLLDDLVEEGLVERTVVPGDRRARCVSVTPLGADRTAELRRRLDTVEEELLSSLPPEKRPVLRELLATLAVGLVHAGEDSASCVDFPGKH